jgi:hypothetical protein
MSIHYIEKKPWEQPLYIEQLIDFIKKDKEYFLIIANLLCIYDTPDSDSDMTEERSKHLNELLIIKGLYDNRPNDEITEFKALIEELYEQKPGILSDTRGEILEAIIYRYGSNNISNPINLTSYYEPQIFDRGTLVGGNNCVIDVVIHDNRGSTNHVANYIECKAAIHSFIDLRFFPRLSKKKRNKWNYIKDIYSYISSKYFIPKIYIASYSNDVYDYQQKLNQNSLDYVTILCDEDIYSMIS